MSGLDALRARVAEDLATLGIGAPTWVRQRPGVIDVAIVGGGQSGLGAAFALRRERVTNVAVLDENPAGYEGPWDTYARMVTLRTPKAITSIDGGIPSLTFRAYWEALHGRAGWDALDKIPRRDWMAYLRWYRDVLDLPVRNGTRVLAVAPAVEGVHRLRVAGPAGEEVLLARKVVLATGIQGGGEWHVPPMIAAALPPARYAHTSAPIDYAALAGKRIAILGGGASAFDNAQHALGEGVVEAHVFVRRPALPTVNPIRHMEQAGLIARFPALGDADKYRMMRSFFARNQPPTNDTFRRAAAWPGFHLHLGAPWLTVRETAAGAEVTTPQGTFTFDFLVLSTGLVTDPSLRPELAAVAQHIARWRDRYAAPDPVPVIDDHPYLGPGFQFLPRDADAAPLLHGLFAFNYSALISLGLSASALSGLKQALPRLASAVADELFLDEKDAALDAYFAYDEPEFVSAWAPPASEAAA